MWKDNRQSGPPMELNDSHLMRCNRKHTAPPAKCTHPKTLSPSL